MATFRENLLTRRDAIGTELAATQDGDSSDYVLRRYQELDYLVKILQQLDTLELTSTGEPGSYEIITIGET